MPSHSAVALLLLLTAGSALAADPENGGPTFTLRFDGTHSDIGFISRLDPAVGYGFNRYLSIDVGLPFYLIRPAPGAVQLLGRNPSSGLGNAHLDLRLNLANPVVNYAAALTVTAPTGDKSAGLTTGHVTYDFSNHFDRRFGRLTPFADLGIANTVTDTPFFVRPFTSLGFVTNLEGGAAWQLVHFASIGGSGYAIEPSGRQTVISRLMMRAQGMGVGSGSGNSSGRGLGHSRTHGVFQTASETTGGPDLVRDHGVNIWLALSPASALDFEIGYSHSVAYALDTVFFGVGVNLGSLAARARHP